jgi:hypothetical protein
MLEGMMHAAVKVIYEIPLSTLMNIPWFKLGAVAEPRVGTGPRGKGSDIVVEVVNTNLEGSAQTVEKESVLLRGIA